jgi:hypothetical protein
MNELVTHVKDVMDANYPNINYFKLASHGAQPPFVVWDFLPAEPEQIYSGGKQWSKIPLIITYYHKQVTEAARQIPLIEAMFTPGALTADSVLRYETTSTAIGEDESRDDTGYKYKTGRIIMKCWYERARS